MAEKSRVARYVGEFLGTFLLAVAIGFNMLSQSWLHAPMGIACALTVLSCALASVSGAHLNPAVTLSLFARNRFSFEETVAYIFMQSCGGVFGAVVYAMTLSETFELRPPKGTKWKQAGAIEFVYTFALCLVMLSMATLKRVPGQDQFRGLAAGFIMVASGYAAGHITRGAGWCNPAVSFGVDIVSTGGKFSWSIIYLNFQGAASLCAALAAFCIWPTDHQRYNEETPTYSLFSKLASEVVGTFLLVFTIALGTVGASEGAPIAIGAILTSLTFALFSCSGAHFNPAVTISVLFGRCGDFTFLRALLYICAQLLGACGAMRCMSVVMKSETRFPIWGASTAGTQGMFGIYRTMAAEGIFTFLLCLVYLRVTRQNSPMSQFFGLAIGMTHTAGSYTVRWISGGVLNPAAIMGAWSTRLSGHTEEKPEVLKKACAMYVSAQIAGAVLAALVCYMLPQGGPPSFEDSVDDEDEDDEDEVCDSAAVDDTSPQEASAAPPPESTKPISAT